MKGLCFDLDGTLIDSGRDGYNRVLFIARSRNLLVNDDTERVLRDLWGMEPKKLVTTLWQGEDPEAFLAAWEEWDISHPHPAFPGTKEALEQLSRLYRMSIITNRYLRTIAPQLEHNSMQNVFGFVSTPETNGFKKPHPQSMSPLLQWYARQGVHREDIIFVGDTVHGDWGLAKTLGLEFYAVTSGGVDSREKFIESGVPEKNIFESVAHLAPTLLERAR